MRCEMWWVLGVMLAMAAEPSVEAETVSPPSPDSTWGAWVDALPYLLEPPEDVVPGRLATQLVVLGDQQVKFLGGYRSRVQSLTADEVVDVSVRPIAVDLFGFTAHDLLRSAVQGHRERAAVRPVYIDPGDVLDLSCRAEIALAYTDPIGHTLPFPDLLTPGNHDLNLVGNVRKGTDIGGVLGILVGGNLKARMWGPVCGSSDPGDRTLALDLIAQKDAFARWWLERGVGPDASWDPIRLDPDGVWHGGRRLSWNDPEVIASTFWHRDGDRAWAALRVQTPCVRTDGPACREPGRAFLLMSAMKVSSDPEMWVIGLDGTDQLRHSRGWPGYYGSMSSAQVGMVRALRTLTGEDSTYVLVNHFPLSDMLLGGKAELSGVVGVFADDQVLFHVAGHTHLPEVRYVDQHDSARLALQRGRPLVEYVAGSTLDHPVGGFVVEVYVDEGEAIRTVAREVSLPWHAVPTSAEVAPVLARHRQRLAAYRRSVTGVQLLLAGGKHGRAGANSARAIMFARTVLVKDSLPLMEHQYDAMTAYLSSVVSLLGEDARQARGPRRESLQTLRKQLSRGLGAALEQRERWTHVDRRPREFLDLFLFSCDLDVDLEVAEPLRDNCVLQIQYLLRRVPMDTLAFELMSRLAAEAAVVDFCTGPYVDSLPPHHRAVCERGGPWLDEVTPTR